jgi:peptide/nickel transport system substrate-binding protein
MPRRRLIALVATIPIVLASQAAYAQSEAPAASDGGEESILTMTRDGGIFPVFHPVRATDNNYALLYLIFDPLVEIESDEQTVVPALADSWTASDDGTVFTFDLADGVTWQDGTPFTADDVVFTATWAAQNPSAFQGFAPNWGEIKGAADIAGTTDPLPGIVAVDPDTVEITLESPNVEFVRLLADAPNVILPKHLLEGTAGDTVEQIAFSTEAPVGTGPYRFVRFEPDQFVELEANPDYFKGAPSIDRIVWKVIPTEQILAQLENGELDFALTVGARNQEQLSANPDLEFPATLDVGMYGLWMRTEAPQLADPRVRQAIYHAVDRRAIIDSVLGGYAQVLWNPPGLNYEDLNQYEFDPDRARELLAEAGYDPTDPIRLVYWKDASQAGSYLPVVQQQLQDVGMNVELSPLELEDWDDMVTNPDRREEWDIELDFGGNFGLGPSKSARWYGTCEGPLRQTGYQNCELRDLFVEARGTSDPAAREEIYHRIGEIINEAADVAYLWQNQVIHPKTTRLTGVDLHPFERYSVMNVEDWELAPR